MASERSAPRLGIALGSGSARGWAHIGVLTALVEQGIEPEIVCGTSIGALVGGIYAAGKLPQLAAWVGSLTPRDVLGLLDFTRARGGMIAGRKLMDLYRQQLGDPLIEELPRTFAAVATDLSTGSEVWLKDGSLLAALRASVSIPGVFTPVLRDGRWLVDGGLVNPVPVSLCRALGAEVVLAVDLLSGAPLNARDAADGEAQPAVVHEGRVGALTRIFNRGAPADVADPMLAPPNLRSIMTTSLDIVQARLSRSRLAGDPPDLLLAPRVRQVASLEFAGGQATIDEGYHVMRRTLPALRDIMGMES